MLAWLSAKVLGQYEVFTSARDQPAAAPRRPQHRQPPSGSSDVDPRDFRLWVCLHEETHRVQFGAVPWLQPHLRGEIRGLPRRTRLLAREPSPTGCVRLVAALSGVARGGDVTVTRRPVQTPEQRVVRSTGSRP